MARRETAGERRVAGAEPWRREPHFPPRPNRLRLAVCGAGLAAWLVLLAALAWQSG
jgi:hypothetical protein